METTVMITVLIEKMTSQARGFEPVGKSAPRSKMESRQSRPNLCSVNNSSRIIISPDFLKITPASTLLAS